MQTTFTGVTGYTPWSTVMQLAGTATMVFPLSRAFNAWRYVSIKPQAAHERLPGRMNSSAGRFRACFVGMIVSSLISKVFRDNQETVQIQ
jgi:hypothetical protein